MSAARLASRYAKALLDLSIEHTQLERVYQDVQAFNNALQNRDFLMMVKSPIVHSPKKMAVMQRIFGDNFHEITSRFIKIIVRKHREFYLPEIVDAFINQYRKHNKIATATLVTATDVDQQTIDKVKQIVLTSTGNTSVELDTSVDPSLIGGFILKYDDKLYDASVAHKLEKLQAKFEEN